VSVLHVSLCVESGDVVCKQRRYQDENTALTQLFFRAKRTSKRMVFRTAGVIQRVTRTVKKRRDLGNVGSAFARLDEYKVELWKASLLRFLPSQSKLAIPREIPNWSTRACEWIHQWASISTVLHLWAQLTATYSIPFSGLWLSCFWFFFLLKNFQVTSYYFDWWNCLVN